MALCGGTPFRSCTISRVCPKWLHFLAISLCPYSQTGLREAIWIHVSLHWVDVSNVASVSQSESRTAAFIMFVLAFWWLYDHLTLYRQAETGKFPARQTGWIMGLKVTRNQCMGVFGIINTIKSQPRIAGIIFLILAHPVYKMWIIQEPNTLELWNKLHFEEKKWRVYTTFKIFSTYICWINI